MASMTWRLTRGLIALALLAAPAGAQAAGNAYVASGGSDEVSGYAVGATGLLAPLTPPSIATGVPFLSDVVVAPDGRSVYVSGVVGNVVVQLDRDPATGLLAPKSPATVASGASPRGLAIAPDGRSLYVANQGSGSVSEYDVDTATGALTPKTPATVAAGPGAAGIAVTPDGRSAYVTDALPFHAVDAAVSQFSIDPATGVLTPKTPAAVASGVSPSGVAVTPDGRSAYVTNQLSGSVSQYDVDPATGALTPKAAPAVASGLGPVAIAVTPDGRSAYTTNTALGSGTTVSQFSIDPATGALSLKDPAEVTAGNLPEDIAVTPDGRSAYVTNGNDNTVSLFAIDAATGALSPQTPATVATGQGPSGVAVSPAPQAPTHRRECRHGGWMTFTAPSFRSRRDCLRYVRRHRHDR
jgi:YVTN family beta-propeller protein